MDNIEKKFLECVGNETRLTQIRDRMKKFGIERSLDYFKRLMHKLYMKEKITFYRYKQHYYVSLKNGK